jgi:hypothetical protein
MKPIILIAILTLSVPLMGNAQSDSTEPYVYKKAYPRASLDIYATYGSGNLLKEYENMVWGAVACGFRYTESWQRFYANIGAGVLYVDEKVVVPQNISRNSFFLELPVGGGLRIGKHNRRMQIGGDFAYQYSPTISVQTLALQPNATMIFEMLNISLGITVRSSYALIDDKRGYRPSYIGFGVFVRW